MQCETCSGTGRRTKHIEYIGHQTLGPCEICGGTGVRDYLKKDLIHTIAKYADATIPARTVALKTYPGPFTTEHVADAFTAIESFDRPVGRLLVSYPLLEEVRLWDIRLVDHIVAPYETLQLWGVEITVENELPDDTFLVLTESEYMFYMGEEFEEGPEDLVAVAGRITT